MEKRSVLVGSPVYQDPEILEAFLASLKSLKSETLEMDFMFVDDNAERKSSEILAAFHREGSNIFRVKGKDTSDYQCNEESHLWNSKLIKKVAEYKNAIIQYAILHEYEYLFLVDSDLILHPNTIQYLISLEKDIVSEIFWSQWHRDKPLEPNVWLFDEYDLVPKVLGEELTEKEKKVRQARFLNKLRQPGVYEVGGLGACTLISREALLKHVNFELIKNLTIWGEDRFFCIRAAVLGVSLFVDTHYPAYHIYRKQDLAGVSNYVKGNEADTSFVRCYKEKGNKVTLSMVVKNEENRYLAQVLNSLKDHIDEAVIIDDGSLDHTVKICETILKDVPLHIIRNEKSLFCTESVLRKLQWDETVKTNPDWILNLDADELLEECFWETARELLDNKDVDVYSFRLYDMWNDTHYREDKYWDAHSIYRPFLVRYQPQFRYLWKESDQHCTRFPINLFSFQESQSKARIKHLGWVSQKDREAKKKRYKEFDPDAIFGEKKQYDSILDTSVNLIRWEEVEKDDHQK